MARYRVLQKSFIGGTIVEEGTEVEYDGEPGPNLELIETAPKSKGKKSADTGEGDGSLA